MTGNVGGLLILACVFLTVTGHGPSVCEEGSSFVFHDGDCTLYYYCALGTRFINKCPFNYVFSSIINTCVEPGSAFDHCSGGKGTGGTGTGGTGTGDTGNGGTGTGGPETGTVVRLFGKKSRAIDGAKSETVCPQGSIPINCQCSAAGAGCDGTVIDNRRCQAFNSFTGRGQQALAVCYYDAADQWTVVNTRLTRRPVARCPAQFRVTSCTIRNRSNHRRAVQVQLQKSINACLTTTVCPYGAGCKVQALCKRIYTLDKNLAHLN